MISSHVAHDCMVGNNVIIANNVPLGGHVFIDDNVVIGGNSAVQQFTRIGKMAMIGGMTGVLNDVIPYGLSTGNRNVLQYFIEKNQSIGANNGQVHELSKIYNSYKKMSKAKTLFDPTDTKLSYPPVDQTIFSDESIYKAVLADLAKGGSPMFLGGGGFVFFTTPRETHKSHSGAEENNTCIHNNERTP